MEKLSFTATFNMTDEWLKFRDEHLAEMQEEQKRVEEILKRKVFSFLSKIIGEEKVGELSDEITFVAVECAKIGWNECFNYHFDKE